MLPDAAVAGTLAATMPRSVSAPMIVAATVGVVPLEKKSAGEAGRSCTWRSTTSPIRDRGLVHQILEDHGVEPAAQRHFGGGVAARSGRGHLEGVVLGEVRGESGVADRGGGERGRAAGRLPQLFPQPGRGVVGIRPELTRRSDGAIRRVDRREVGDAGRGGDADRMIAAVRHHVIPGRVGDHLAGENEIGEPPGAGAAAAAPRPAGDRGHRKGGGVEDAQRVVALIRDEQVAARVE